LCEKKLADLDCDVNNFHLIVSKYSFQASFQKRGHHAALAVKQQSMAIGEINGFDIIFPVGLVVL